MGTISSSCEIAETLSLLSATPAMEPTEFEVPLTMFFFFFVGSGDKNSFDFRDRLHPCRALSLFLLFSRCWHVYPPLPLLSGPNELEHCRSCPFRVCAVLLRDVPCSCFCAVLGSTVNTSFFFRRDTLQYTTLQYSSHNNRSWLTTSWYGMVSLVPCRARLCS